MIMRMYINEINNNNNSGSSGSDGGSGGGGAAAAAAAVETAAAATAAAGGDGRQWRLATLPFAFGGLGVYSTGDVLNYAFLASQLQSVRLQTKLLRHTDIVASRPNFDDVLHVFNTSMETDFFSNPSEIAAPKLMKKKADIYFTRVAKNAESTFSLPPRQMALWKSQMEDQTSDWLMTVPIYRWGRDKPLRPADMLLYSWDRGLDVCVDLTRSSPLTQTDMADFVPGRAVIDVAQRKCGKYMDNCAAIGYEFLLFSFSSLGELEADAVILLKQIRKFSMTQDIGASAVVRILNRIGFFVAKGVGAHIVSRLPSNFL
ncbi:hypothetical protein Tco_1259804 [Tanacetum coccineum]